MKTQLSLLALSALLIGTTVSCKKKGCMNQDAVNYNSEAKKDDGTCKYTPTITVNGNNPENINVGDTYTDAGATATNKDGSSVNVTTTSQVDASTNSGHAGEQSNPGPHRHQHGPAASAGWGVGGGPFPAQARPQEEADAGHEEVESLVTQQNRAAQSQPPTHPAQLVPQGGQFRQRDKLVGSDVCNGGHGCFTNYAWLVQ